MKNTRKKLAMLLSAAMAVSMLASCGGDKNEAEAPETQQQTTTLATENAENTDPDPINFFGEDYDPFSDDYDPYGGNGASAAKHDPETASNAGNSGASDGGNGSSSGSAGNSQTGNSSSGTASSGNSSNSSPVPTSSGNSGNSSSGSNNGSSGNSSGSSDSKAAPEGVSLVVNSSNSWDNGSDKFSQIDVSVKNNSDKVISGWKVTIPAASGVAVDQKWNCDISISGGTLTVTPVDYNSTVDIGSESTCGMILINPGSIDGKKATVTVGSTTVSGSSGNGGNSGGNGGQSGSVGNNNPKIVQAKDVPAPTTDDWLYTDGSKILDKDGKEVWLTGINWFGYNTGTNTFDGLWACDLNTSIAAIADRGFNLLRIPISSELIKNWSNGNYPTANFNQATNSYLVGMNSLEIFDYVIGQCRANGIKIMIDIHSAKTDSMGHMYNVWYNGNISEKDYLDSLAWIAGRYKNDDTIIAYDLKNEPHGKAGESPRAKWDGSKDSDNWKYIAEKAAKAVLDKNPNVLVMVEGIEIYPIDTKKNGDFSSTNMGDYYTTWWGGNLRGVKNDPVNLGKYQNKLVYSPHDYGPTVYEQPWFKGGYTFESLYKDCWYDNWFYIQKENIAPLLIGEWGGFMREPNLTWMKYLRKLIKDNRINHTFWCFNSNSGDTGGLVLDDFTTWDEEKYAFVKEVLWQQNGKFVGLDHEIPLGSNGITLSQAK